MNEQEIIDIVNAIFEDSFEIEKEELHEDKNIFTDLGLDSLDIVDLVVALQKKFNVKIRNDVRVRNIRTMGDLYNYVNLLNKEGLRPE